MSKKIKLFCGPSNYHIDKIYFEEADEFIVGVDSGLKLLLEKGMAIDLAIGDFDSIDPSWISELKQKHIEIIRLEPQKNMTDLAFAVDYLYNHMEYSRIEIYGGIGGRVDHFLANLNLLKRYELSFRDDNHWIFVLKKGKHPIQHFHRYISFFALEDCYNLSLQGFKYELNNYFLGISDSLCVSNEGSGTVDFSKGRLLVVTSDDVNPFNEVPSYSSQLRHVSE
ncbi:MAG: thiamine diphosphokinase [Candidatus Izemoplasmatales bacterium]|jgi:thiamine pyrophosphokinase|nr:thiamine diphosphokinase [Candidatus Izemoplasmatales bacterium]MDD4987939.1 thiamine diphosphokinase [Candidatus Izemoplasmatales bacterium]MDY0372492.1 thiamine diphosphokinase [Candidatus Izemoplasmatales bacterium]NLF48636.1 thiamine diphosphokinase [Acholeplasmataceae bacterium]